MASRNSPASVSYPSCPLVAEVAARVKEFAASLADETSQVINASGVGSLDAAIETLNKAVGRVGGGGVLPRALAAGELAAACSQGAILNAYRKLRSSASYCSFNNAGALSSSTWARAVRSLGLEVETGWQLVLGPEDVLQGIMAEVAPSAAGMLLELGHRWARIGRACDASFALRALPQVKDEANAGTRAEVLAGCCLLAARSLKSSSSETLITSLTSALDQEHTMLGETGAEQISS